MKLKRIEMLDSRVVAGYGLKVNGEVWSAPTHVADQLCSQGFAKLVNAPVEKEKTVREPTTNKV